MAASLRALFMFRHNHYDLIAFTTPGESELPYRQGNRNVSHDHQDVAVIKEQTPQRGQAVNLRATRWRRRARKAADLRQQRSALRLLQKEDEIREEFVRRAPSLTAHKPDNAWEWYFLMQHYGAPTRLLDWTEDPQMGLYFAVKDSEGLHDAAVWVVDAWRLNKQVVGEYEVVPPGSPGLCVADSVRYRPWLPDRFDAKRQLKKKLPVAVYPNQFDQRIAAQRSCFTVHGVLNKGLDKLFEKSKRLLAKILVPGYAAERIREELEENGVDGATIYPDLEGLGKCVGRWLPVDEEIPHEGLYTRLKPSPIDGVGVFAIKKIKERTPIFSGDSDEIR